MTRWVIGNGKGPALLRLDDLAAKEAMLKALPAKTGDRELDMFRALLQSCVDLEHALSARRM